MTVVAPIPPPKAGRLRSPGVGYTFPVKIALAQINSTVGDFSGNAAKIVAFARRGPQAGRELAALADVYTAVEKGLKWLFGAGSILGLAGAFGVAVSPDGRQVWYAEGDRYYYGYFWEGMPDLNLRNEAVTDELDSVARFWVDEMGAAGLRAGGARQQGGEAGVARGGRHRVRDAGGSRVRRERGERAQESRRVAEIGFELDAFARQRRVGDLVEVSGAGDREVGVGDRRAKRHQAGCFGLRAVLCDCRIRRLRHV